MRTFDIGQQFEKVKEAAISAINNIFPVEGRERKIVLEKAWVDDKLDPSDYQSQLGAKSKEGVWGAPVYASLKLVDKRTGAVIDSASRMRMFTLPKYTDRFSYIVGGNEYQVANQLRLKPGVYTIRKDDGTLKTQVNLAKGKNFELAFDEATGKFFMTSIGGSSSKIPLYPLLAHLGMSHAEITKYWGTKIADANKSTDGRIMDRFQKAFNVNSKEEITSYLNNKTSISPETTKSYLGEAFDKVDGKMLLASSKDLLETHKGKKTPKNRDSLEFKKIMGMEDFIKERIEKNQRTLLGKIRRVVDNPNRNKLTSLINTSTFDKTVQGFFTADDKASTPDQTNPLSMLSETYKTTIMGAGGISSDHALTETMRELHPSHYGFLDPIHTPEGDRIGANLNMALGAIKDGEEIKKVVYDRKGNRVTITPTQAYNSYVAFPEQKNLSPTDYRKGVKDLPDVNVEVLHQGQVKKVPTSKVDYFTPRATSVFTWSGNLIPFLASNQGTRAMMASKHIEQAISLKHREPARVQAGITKNKSFDQHIGERVSKRSPVDGMVTRITKDAIHIKSGRETHKVNLYDNFPLNLETVLQDYPLVKVGDKVKKDQVIADNNYTKNGTLALGTNLKAAYIPYKGYNFEDGIVITESAAEKLTSNHIRKKSLYKDENVILDMRAFNAHYPTALTLDNREKLDADGVIKKGSVVKNGDVVIAALRNQSASRKISLLSKRLSKRPKDVSVTWHLEDEGRVINVNKSGKNVIVFIRTEERAKIGDKLSGRMGNKGIITKIIPDEEAPKNAKGEHVQILLNPAGVIGRINVNQIYESAVGKAAKKSGATHIVENFKSKDHLQDVKKYLEGHKTDDKEELFDGDTGKSLGRVHVGLPHILKLYKQSSSSYSVRQGGPGSPYDMNMQPQKAGGQEAAKNLDTLDFYSMLAHGARNNLREMATAKADKNDDFWQALKSGQMLPPPKEPEVYSKFLAYLKGAGIDTKKEGTKIRLLPLTDQHIKATSSGEIEEPLFYQAKDLSPKKKGFFDPVKTGGLDGERWTHLELKEPVVNPIFEDAVKKVLGIGSQYQKIMSGELFLNKSGQFTTDDKGLTGGAAIEELLKKIDVDKDLKDYTKKALTAKGAELDRLNKKIRYLTNIKKFRIRPEQAFMRKVVPVIPPKYRPIYTMPNGSVATSDVNYLYQNTGVINKMMGLEVMKYLPEKEKKEIRADLYKGVKAISGLENPTIKGMERNGFIAEIAGPSPKEGYFQRKILSKRQDLTGWATIIPEPDLGPDEVALPDHMSWKLFEPFIIKEMRKYGKSPLQAMEEVKRKTPWAKRIRELVMQDRKVILNRDPSLHKFSVMAFKPKVTEGKSIKIPPLVVKGFNADFDGDTMFVHVPISDEAVKEADKLLPSRNLFKPGFGDVMLLPQHEAQLGLYQLSKTPEGQAKINKIVGRKYAIRGELTAKGTKELLAKIGKEQPAGVFGTVVQDLKKLGDDTSYKSGFTLGVEDVPDLSPQVDKVTKIVKRGVEASKSDADLKYLNRKAAEKIDAIIEKNLKGKNNPLYEMAASGARGNKNQLRQILGAPLFVEGGNGKIVPKAITKSFAKGLSMSEYWTSLYGSRKSIIEKSVQTSLPGAASKEILATTINNVITMKDCGTGDGIELPIASRDVLDRFLSKSQGGFAKNALVDGNMVNRLKKAGITKLVVRTPLKCIAPKGTCSMCYGLDEHGHAPSVGDNVGIKAGQSISEPLTQGILQTFHTGGTAGSTDAGGFKRVEQLLEIPRVIPGAAPLAEAGGSVEKITKGLAGGYDVTLAGKKYHVPKGRELKIKVGQKVKKGDALSTGTIKPQDLVKLKGMFPAQTYITDEMQKAYEQTGAKIDRKVFETIVRSLGNLTRVLNNPTGTHVLPGDVISYTYANHYNKNLKDAVDVEDAEGMTLSKGYGGLKPGQILDSKGAMTLKASGIDKVEIAREPIKHAPFIKGVKEIPLLRKDWMAALGFRNLKRALIDGAQQGWSTDLESYHPVPAFARGVTFGKGKEGKY